MWSVSCRQLNFSNFVVTLLMPDWIFSSGFSRKSFHPEVVLLAVFFMTSDFNLNAPMCSGCDCNSLGVCCSFPHFSMDSFRDSSWILQVRNFTSHCKNPECQIVPQRINNIFSLLPAPGQLIWCFPVLFLFVSICAEASVQSKLKQPLRWDFENQYLSFNLRAALL